jgi:multiple sugar transport system substrate-binding protein
MNDKTEGLDWRSAGGYAAAACIALFMAYYLVSSSRAEAPEPDRRIPVYYWHMWSGEWQPVMENVIKKFNASQTRYRVIPLQVPYGEADTKFLLSVAGGDPPDVMAQWDQAISTWSQGGVLQPLDTFMTPAERRFFLHDTYPVDHQNGWYKNHLYGLVMGVDVYACYYQPAQFQKAGLDPDHFPTTLDQLTAESEKLNILDPDGSYQRVGFLPASLTQYAPAFGGFYDARTGQVELDTPQNLRTLQYFDAVQSRLGRDKVLRFSSGLKSQDGPDWSFIDGAESIVLDGEWRVSQLKKYAPNLDYRVEPLPPASGGKPLSSFTVTNFLTIPAGAKHPDGAWAFIKYWYGLDDPASAAAFFTSFSWLPTSPTMAASPVYRAYLKANPQFGAFVRLAASPNLVATPPVPYQNFLMDRVTSADDRAERGASTPAQALATLQADVNRERRRRRELHYDQ